MLDKRKRPGWLARKMKDWRNGLADRMLQRVERSGRRNSAGAIRARGAEIEKLSREETLRFLQEENKRLTAECGQLHQDLDETVKALYRMQGERDKLSEELRQVGAERDEFEKQVEKLWRDFTRFMQSNAELGNLVMDWVEAINGIDELRINGRKIIERAENVSRDFIEKYGRKESQGTQEDDIRTIEPGMPIGELLGFPVVEKVGMKSPDLSGAYLRQVPPPPDAHKRGG